MSEKISVLDREKGYYCTLLCNTSLPTPLYCLQYCAIYFPHDPIYSNKILAISCKGQAPGDVSQVASVRQLSPDTSPHTAAAGAASPAWPRLASSWQGRYGPAGARRTLARARARRTSTLLPMRTSARPPTLAWEVALARTVVAQPPIAAKWFGRVFSSCVRLCGGSCGVCVVRVTCVLFFLCSAPRVRGANLKGCWRVGFPRGLFPPLWCFPPRCLGAVPPPVPLSRVAASFHVLCHL